MAVPASICGMSEPRARIDELELQLGDALERFARFVDLLRVQAGDLHEDLVRADGRDDRLADAEAVHAAADDFHGGFLRLAG